MAKCIQELKVCKTARERLDYAFNLTREFSWLWEADKPFALGVCVRPAGDPTGLEYVSSGGQSGAEEPQWPDAIGGTVQDGSITWTARTLTNDSLAHRIASVDWDSVAGITLSDQIETDLPGLQEARIWASGGTAGKVYLCSGIVTTMDGNEYEIRLRLTVDP